MIDRVMRLEAEEDARLACRLVGRAVQDPNLRGWAVLVRPLAAADEHLLRAAVARTRVLALGGSRGTALLGDLFSLHSAGRELAALGAPAIGRLGARLLQATETLDGGPPSMDIGARRFDWTRPVVMGVVNVTPDSFSDGGLFVDPLVAVEHGCALVEAGADILDVGGESTRPRGSTYGAGAETVSAPDEIARVVPVIRALRARVDVPVSVDTRKAAVARAAIEAGATLVNDVTGLLHDPELGRVVAGSGAALCLMHVPADIERLSHEQPSRDIVGEVLRGLEAALERATVAGVARERVLLDPGLGFGKLPAHNLYLLRHLECVCALGRPVLVGASRKATFARAAAAPGDGPLPVEERLPASVAAAVAAWLGGARVLRVHDVRETVRALRVAAAIRGAADAGADFA